MPEPVPSPAPTSQRRCQNCNSFVSRQFSRVFGDNDDVVHYCPECNTFSNLFDGHGSGPRS
ncbi:DUF7563 family protein [Halorarius litoreus]|uniref:DUF7563 family protein n=1 Tax=Halorarius litoreus TaxID=2962676 RepID=UPI00331389A1